MAFVGRAYAQPTNELLELVPADAAACLIVEDFKGHYQRFIDSKLWANARQTRLVKEFQHSPPFRHLLKVWTFFPFYFGVTGEQIRDDLLGRSVVLALRPGREAGHPAVGIVYCRAADETLAATIAEQLTTQLGGRKVESRTHRGVSYRFRQEADGHVDHLLRLGPVLVASDSESAIHEVVDCHLDGNGVGKALDPILASIPRGSLLKLVVNARRVDDFLQKHAKEDSAENRRTRERLLRIWKNVDWAALTAGMDSRGALQADLHLGVGEATPANPTNDFWRKVPADALGAAVFDVPFARLWRLFCDLQPERRRDDLNVARFAAEQFLGGVSLDGLFDRVGPRVAFVCTRDPQRDAPQVLGVVSLRETEPEQAGGLSLSETIESLLRPLFVFAALDHDRRRDDRMRLETRVVEGRRLHVLTGSTLLPGALEPSFAVGPKSLAAASHPSAVVRWWSEPQDSIASSGRLQELLGGYPDGAKLRMYVDVAAVVAMAKRNQDHLANLEQGNPDRIARARRNLGALFSIIELFDDLTWVHYRKTDSHHWSFRLTTNP